MEVWIDERRPDVVSTTNMVLAVLLHLAFFVAVFVFAKLHFKPKETIIPIDLTIVVNENLDGNENEPPPVDDPPPPDPPKPPPPPPPPPKPVDEPKIDAVVKIKDDKPKPPKKKDPPKKEEPKKEEKKPDPPKPPEKTKEQLREERMKKMRESATLTKVKIKVPDAPSGNGRTEKQTLTEAEIRKRLGEGYKPGAKTQLAENEMQFCLSRIQQAIDARWNVLHPPIGAEGMVEIAVRLTPDGRLVNCRIRKGCGDRTSDKAALTVVQTTGAVAGLDREFLRRFAKEDLVIRYKVMSR